jgi:hypothetical protein
MTRGRLTVVAILAVAAIFGAALWWFQVYAFYERQSGVGALRVAGEVVPIADYDGIDAATSPLKLRGCFRADPAAFAAAEPAPDATPLVAPSWFDCFDVETLTEDLAAGRARAYALEHDAPAGFDLLVAIYPDGRGYLWRQLGKDYAG